MRPLTEPPPYNQIRITLEMVFYIGALFYAGTVPDKVEDIMHNGYTHTMLSGEALVDVEN